MIKNYSGLEVGFLDNIDIYKGRDTLNSSPLIDNYSTKKIHPNSWIIFQRGSESMNSILHLLVPGDYVGIDGHAAIINKITYINDRLTTQANVQIIESTTWDGWYVQDVRFLLDYSADIHSIRRFKPKIIEPNEPNND